MNLYTRLEKVSKKVVNYIDNKIKWLYLRISLYEGRKVRQEALSDYNSVETIKEIK